MRDKGVRFHHVPIRYSAHHQTHHQKEREIVDGDSQHAASLRCIVPSTSNIIEFPLNPCQWRLHVPEILPALLICELSPIWKLS